MAASPSSIADVAAGLRSVGYLPGESTALVSFLAAKLGKPILVEGPAGGGKAGLARGLSQSLGRRLVRLQCYEGLDEAKALYEWNYRKQLLRIQAEAEGAGWQEVQDDIFGEEFLLERPLMSAIAAEEPVVLLIDEIDKTDQEFEAMLLELLSDFQISIPELGRFEARTRPIVLLTSNNTRERTEALKRPCLYLWLDYPQLEHELQIVKLHTPDLDDAIARKLVEIVAMVRELDLKKPPSIAESIDWARALLLLGADDIDNEVFVQTMSVIVKHRTDLDVVAERVGMKLPVRAASAGQPWRRALRAHGARRCSAGPRRPPPPVRRGAARRGRRGRHERAPRRLRGPARGAVDDRRGLPRGPGRDAREVAGGPPRLRSRLRPLLLPRDRARRRARGHRRGRRDRCGRRGAQPRDAAPGDRASAARGARGADARPRPPRDRRVRAPGRGLGRHRRRRAAHPPPARPARRAAARAARGGPAPRRPAARCDPPLRGAPAPGARARADRAHRVAAARAAAERARPRAAERAPPGSRGGAPRRRPAHAAAERPRPGEPRDQAPRAR